MGVMMRNGERRDLMSRGHGLRGQSARTLFRRGFVLMAAATSFGGCSLLLDWSPQGTQCDTTHPCAEQYSCLVNRCVAEGSLLTGETCSTTVQCENNPQGTDCGKKGNPDCVICGSAPFTCRKRCLDNYLAGSAGICATGEYCKPEPDRDRNNEQWTGTCVASECTTQEDCNGRSSSAKSCVTVTPSASACLLTCESPNYDCGSGPSGQVYCQPIGTNNTQTLVCLSRLDDNVSALPMTNEICRLVSNPCRSGDACFGTPGETTGYCRRYCDPTTTDPCAALGSNYYCCTLMQEGSPVFSACMPDHC